MKKVKGLKNAHTSNSKIGMGDNYGSGIRQPMAKPREDLSKLVTPKRLKKPPKSLA